MHETFARMGEAFLDVGLLTLPLLGALSVLALLWGAMKFFWPAEDMRSREEGKRTLVIAAIVVFLSVALWLILDYVADRHDAPQQGVKAIQ